MTKLYQNKLGCGDIRWKAILDSQKRGLDI